MLTNGIENISESLEQVEAAYRTSLEQLPSAGEERLARRVQHFASAVRFGLADPDAMRCLHDLTKDLRTIPRPDSLLPKVLEGALSLTGADFGNIQILDPATGSLKIVTQAGFGPEFLDYFAVVDDNQSACGRAARQGAQIVVADVTPRDRRRDRIPGGPIHTAGRLYRSPDRHGLDPLPAPTPSARSRSADHGTLR